MAIVEQTTTGRSLVRADRRAAGDLRSPRARVRGEGDPPARGPVRREPDASGGRAREGPRAGSHEHFTSPRSSAGRGSLTFDGILVLDEALSWGCSGIAVSIIVNTLGAAPVVPRRQATSRSASGSRRLLEEPILCSFALTEPNAGSDVSGIQTTAVRRRRRLRHQRLEDVHLERGPRGLDGRLRLDRQEQGAPRALGVHRPGRRRRLHGREAPRQDGPAGDRHLCGCLPGRQGAGRQPARRGRRGIQDRDAHARPHAAGHCDRRPSASPRAAYELSIEYSPRARPVRPADRDEPGRQLPDRRHGRRDRSRTAAHLAGGMAPRPGEEGDARVLDREALRLRHGR